MFAKCFSMDDDTRREQIMDKAQHLFVGKGIKGTTMSDIAAAVALGKPVLYQYFASKDEIVEEVINRQVQTLMSYIIRGITETDNPLVKLAKLWNNAIDFYDQDDFLLHVLKDNAIGLPPYLYERVVMDVETYIVNLLEQLYQEAVDKDLFVECNTHVAAYISYRIYQAGTYHRSETIKNTSARQILKWVMEVFGIGLLNPQLDLTKVFSQMPLVGKEE